MSFENNESSILSDQRSICDGYASFFNDIRTVHELEEECKLTTSYPLLIFVLFLMKIYLF